MKTHVPRLWVVVAGMAGVMAPSAGLLAADLGPGSHQQQTSHTFRYLAPPGAATVAVSVAGDFNAWSSTANPMVRESDGSYAVTMPLPAGLQHYKIVYDGKWLADPTADKSIQVDNGFGDVLSSINIPPVGATPYTFRYVPAIGSPTKPVSIAGDFNGWSTVVNPMVRGTDGVYSVTVQLVPGVHHYKIVSDGNWMVDPADDKSLEVDDGFGGKNSGVSIAEPLSPATQPAVEVGHTARAGNDAAVTGNLARTAAQKLAAP